MALDVCPPPGAGLPARSWVAASCGLLLVGSMSMLWAQRRLGTGSQRGLRFAVLLALVSVGVAFALAWAGHAQAGLSPRAQAWSATVATLLAWQGLHAAVLVVMGVYVLARSWSGKLATPARATLDNSALLWHYTTVQGLAAAALVQGLPRLLG
jgi:cytochrome c oxidase subunit I+III